MTDEICTPEFEQAPFCAGPSDTEPREPEDSVVVEPPSEVRPDPYGHLIDVECDGATTFDLGGGGSFSIWANGKIVHEFNTVHTHESHTIDLGDDLESVRLDHFGINGTTTTLFDVDVAPCNAAPVEPLTVDTPSTPSKPNEPPTSVDAEGGEEFGPEPETPTVTVEEVTESAESSNAVEVAEVAEVPTSDNDLPATGLDSVGLALVGVLAVGAGIGALRVGRSRGKV